MELPGKPVSITTILISAILTVMVLAAGTLRNIYLFNLLDLTYNLRQRFTQLCFRCDGIKIAPESIITIVRLIRKYKAWL